MVKYLPLERIMTETDCPYITPTPYRGKRNEPAFVSYVVAKLAQIKGLEVDAVKDAVLANAIRVFKLPLN